MDEGLGGASSHAALIVAVARQRDREAFAVLFEHFAPRVKAYLQRIGSDSATAEEMAQDVLLSVWRKAGQYDPVRASPGAWIFAIARNHRIDRLRRNRPAPLRSGAYDDPAPVVPPDVVVAADERGRRVREALGSLPPQQREMLRLAFFEDRPHSEIQGLLGVPLGTVKSRLRLAISKLRLALKDEP